MRIGYDRLLRAKETIEEKTDLLLGSQLDRVVIELYTTKEVYPASSQLTRLLGQSERGDTLVVPRLESVSDSPVVWRQLLLALQKQGLTLEVIASPSLSIDNWLEVMTWWQAESKETRSRIISVEKERDKDARRIRAFAKEPDYRELYWQIFKELQRGASLRRTAKRLKVSQGTVLRIKRDVAKLVQTLWLIGTFGITVASLKIAQAYSTNWVLQVLICAVATVLIGYLSYSDIKESES